ncbi:hypothetical protein [Palaeococcus sp. (in: euryarchaeotes)]
MRLLKFFVLSILLTILISLLFQLKFSINDFSYPLISISDRMEYGMIYSPSAASVKVSISCSNKTVVSVRDVERNTTIYTGVIYRSDLISLVFPHPGYYEFSTNSTSVACSIVVKPLKIGFPTRNWNTHFIFGSLMAFMLAFLIWRGGRDS